MIDYGDIDEVNKALTEAQDADKDNRDRVREAHNFLDKRDGQWEPEIIRSFNTRPRYTFDKCNPVVDDIAGELESADFDIRIRPSGGDATKEIAKTYDGLIRNIETISNAQSIYSDAGRDMIASGLSGFEIAVNWVDGDSFDQDFIIKLISNFEDRVWYDAGSIMQDRSDAKFVFVLDNLRPDVYKDRFPEGSGASIGASKNRISDVYFDKPEFITIGRMIYKQPIKKELVLMDDGSVYEVNEDFERVSDELAQSGVREQRRRTKESFFVKSRLFDGGDFLTEAQDTVFKGLPIIPMYGNFKVREGKVIYRGAIEKLMDAQRVYNYCRSREIEEVVLSPKPKYWATRKQFSNASDRQRAETLNTNADPIQFFSHDSENPGPPKFQGGAAVNPGLLQVTQNTIDDIKTTSDRSTIDRGDTDGPLSGIAIQKLENKGNTNKIKYFKSVEKAVCRAGRILVDALPELYDTPREKRILNEDGSFEMITIRKQVIDLQTGKTVMLNDLSQGKYDVTCDVGPAFQNRQQESIKALTELSAANQLVAESSADIILNNIASPGVDIVAERVRGQMLNAGLIPETQLTDEERAAVQQAQALAAQQPPEPSPEDKLAEAEIKRVQAETADVQANAILEQEKLRIQEQKNLLDAQNKAEKLQLEELSLIAKQNQEQIKQQNAIIEANIKGQAQVIESLNTQAKTLETLRKAMGVDTIVGPHATEAFIQQAETITAQQDEIRLTPETDDITETS